MVLSAVKLMMIQDGEQTSAEGLAEDLVCPRDAEDQEVRDTLERSVGHGDLMTDGGVDSSSRELLRGHECS